MSRTVPAPIVDPTDPNVPPSHRDITKGMYWSVSVMRAAQMPHPRVPSKPQNIQELRPILCDSAVQRKGPEASPAIAADTLSSTF